MVNDKRCNAISLELNFKDLEGMSQKFHFLAVKVVKFLQNVIKINFMKFENFWRNNVLFSGHVSYSI